MGFGKNLEGTPVKFSVPEQREFAFDFFVSRADGDARLLFRQRLEAGDDIGQRPGAFFQLPTDQLDGPRIEAGPAELREITLLRLAILQKIRAAQVNFGLDRKSTRLNSSH